jgi:hypothetical protein
MGKWKDPKDPVNKNLNRKSQVFVFPRRKQFTTVKAHEGQATIAKRGRFLPLNSGYTGTPIPFLPFTSQGSRRTLNVNNVCLTCVPFYFTVQTRQEQHIAKSLANEHWTYYTWRISVYSNS